MPAAGGLGEPGQPGTFGRRVERLVAPEAAPIARQRLLDVGLATPELSGTFAPASPVGQLGEPLERSRRRGLNLKPLLQGL